MYQFTDKLNLKNPKKNMALANIKTLNLNATTINLKYVLQLGIVSSIYPMDLTTLNKIQDYFEYVIKKHGTIADNPPVQIYVNKIKKQDCL